MCIKIRGFYDVYMYTFNISLSLNGEFEKPSWKPCKTLCLNFFHISKTSFQNIQYLEYINIEKAYVKSCIIAFLFICCTAGHRRPSASIRIYVLALKDYWKNLTTSNPNKDVFLIMLDAAYGRKSSVRSIRKHKIDF